MQTKSSDMGGQQAGVATVNINYSTYSQAAYPAQVLNAVEQWLPLRD